ncbi:hypothetical protein LQV63_13810 [Paenibacillus profundus]|uniref:Zinc ribbon domain-containing protein n=1 Tax=Paenibacillus profundus TaxID=1173085 RepID=A0ABS8YFQ3_9BACL|nr:hypothetical protein [Paenibacillus profundus]MCE5170387.1 hypothetical protein [Paenibacillus profundus]
MQGRNGTILQRIGGMMLFIQVLIILSLIINWSSFDGAYKIETMLMSVFAISVPGVLLFKAGENMKRKADAIKAMHQQGIVVRRKTSSLGNVLRVFGGIFLFLFGIIVMVITLYWSTQKDKLELFLLFLVLVFTPGVMMYRAGGKLNKKAAEQDALQQAAFMEFMHNPLLSHKEEDGDWDDDDREEDRGQSARQAAAEAAASVPPSRLPKMIACSGCGAQNSVPPGATVTCEYCGSTISYL